MNKNIKFNELFFSKVSDFLNIYEARQQNKSSHTIKAYKIALSSFCDYIQFVLSIPLYDFSFDKCTYDLLLNYSLYLLEEKKYSPYTVNQKMAAIKSYLEYVSDGNIEMTQCYLAAKKVPLQKIPKIHRPIIEDNDLEVLLSLPKNTYFGRRDQMILILLYDSAIRVSELTGITMADISIKPKESTIIIHGKGKKTRCISLSENCEKHLKEYIKHYHSTNKEKDTPLFYTTIHSKINHMSSRNIERIIDKYTKKARKLCPDMPEKIYPHMFRRTRATGLYRDGTPIEIVSAILGHSNTEVTKIYAIPSIEQIRQALNKGQKNVKVKKLYEGKEDELRKMFGL